MPPRRDIRSILLIGSGPIIIGQACEFDYSGTQAAKVLRSHGYRVILVNSNTATIMTDPEFADATYIEPITPEVVEEIIARERPDALLPTLGGQTALNVASELARSGVLDRHGVQMIGAGLDAIDRAEDRGLFKETMEEAGLEVPRAGYARSMGEALRIAGEIGYPLMIRPSFIRGGGGTGIANDEDEFVEKSRCWDGRSSSSKSCGIESATRSSSVPSKTSIPWGCTQVTRSRSLPSKLCPTGNIRRCATRASRSCR